jgi:transcriptional regulator with XRE-family HTH domain
MSSRRPAIKPPRPTPAASRHTLSYQLRELIDARGLSAYGVGQLAGVDAGVVQRFLTGKRDIRLETADQIAAALGLRLVEVAKRGRAPARFAAEGVGPEDVQPQLEGAM